MALAYQSVDAGTSEGAETLMGSGCAIPKFQIEVVCPSLWAYTRYGRTLASPCFYATV